MPRHQTCRPPHEPHPAKTTLAPSAPSQCHNLGEAVFHVAQGNMHTDGFPTGDTEDLGCFVHIFGTLHRIVEEPVKQCRLRMCRVRHQVLLTHLIIAHSLLLATQNDGLKFMELTLHVLQAGVGVLLLTENALKHFLAMLLSNAGATLPLLDAMGKDLMDASGMGDSKKWNG